MLRDSKGNKYQQLDISEQQRKNMLVHVRKRIIQMLNAAQKLVRVDHKISAGIYTYAIEEFGKLLVLLNTPFVNGKYTVNYANEFTCHQTKFRHAIEYLQDKYAETLKLLESSFSPKSFTSTSFTTRSLVANFEARQSIFYSDFKSDGNIAEIPPVDPELLLRAIDELKVITDMLSIP